MTDMNKTLKGFATAIVASVATFFVLIFSGLGTTSIADVNGVIHSCTTVNLGANEFGILTISVVLLSVIATGLVLNAKEKNQPN